jgi:hypothetical protein
MEVGSYRILSLREREREREREMDGESAGRELG